MDILAHTPQAKHSFLSTYEPPTKIIPFYIFNKFRYIDPNRTTCHTKRLYAIEATSSLQNGLFTCKPTIHLFPISYAVSWIELFHFHPRYIGTFLSLSTFTQLFSPFSARCADNSSLFINITKLVTSIPNLYRKTIA